jgi:hypothetical protein
MGCAMTNTMWAALLAPIVGGVIYLPGKLVYRWLWKRMPDGKLRTFLLKDR